MIRNMALMRNIGKYSFYSEPLFPEVGMVYNIYEHVLNRPGDIGLVNGVIGYNNGLDNDDELKGAETFKETYYTSNSEVINERKQKGIAGDNDSISDASVNNRKAPYKKIVYTTNSDSFSRSGGDAAMGEVLKEVNKIFLPENQYSDLEAGFSVNIPSVFGGNQERGSLNPRTYQTVNDTKGIRLYPEGKAYDLATIDENTNIPDDQVLDYMPFGDGIHRTHEEIYGAKNNVAGGLLRKTCSLFRDGKINSIINRFYAEDSQDGPLSRGRNLKREGAENLGGGYDNPYCRVWTSHHQYSRMTNLIRPRIEDDDFASIERIQGKYGEGIRPADGARRLSDMSVLKPNGFVNFAPHQDKGGNLDKESIKKCMFSIENLAWRDVQINETVKRGRWVYNNEKKEWTYDQADETKAPVLTEEQRGPNGGRIMWFPPYNLNFSEDVTTNWNSNTFIGRGENMYTYVNTERGGSLSFTLLIDHPSIVNKWKSANSPIDGYGNEEKILRFFAGCDDLGEESQPQEVEQEEPNNDTYPVKDNVTPLPAPELKTVKVCCFFPNNYTGVDDEIVGAYNPFNLKDSFVDYMYRGIGNTGSTGYESINSIGTGTTLSSAITGKTGKEWYYKIDKSLEVEILKYDNNYYDNNGFGLNEFNNNTPLNDDAKGKMVAAGFITNEEVYGTDYFSFYDLCDALKQYGITPGGDETAATWLWVLLNTEQIANIERVEVRGYASSHGHEEKNRLLAQHRAETLKALILEKRPTIKETDVEITIKKIVGLDETNHDVSSLDAKLGRCAEVIFYVSQNKEVPVAPPVKEEPAEKEIYKDTRLRDYEVYDNEYTYFKDIQASESFIKSRITEKIKYFDPAFHSISPEGFNARLTFLHQCTRQGPTIAASDTNALTESTGVGNLAFGRAPYCVLRIGDFYNTKILIESISINYAASNGGVQWDLNPEGVGVQPMMADVQMRFKFVGGTDISGPIERLQNAVSFNYYSNASIYDRRADYRNSMVNKADGNTPTDNPVYYFDARTQKDKKENQGI